MTSTVSSAVAVRARQDKLIAWLRNQQDDIAMAAASHIKPAAIIRVTQGALRRNPKLAEAAITNPQSLLYALLDAARLGHEPDTDDYYLVPFGGEVTGIEGYKGIIERMYRAGGVSSVVAQVVRQRDVFADRGENTPPLHEYDVFAAADTRGPLRGVYAYALFPGGHCSQVIRMGRAEVMEHKAKSRGSEKADSPWQQWEPAMWKKTALRALEPYVPTSAEYRTAAPGAQPAVFHRIQPEPAVNARAAEPEPVYDADIVDDPPPSGDVAKRDDQPQAASKTAADKLDGLLDQLGYSDDDQNRLIHWVAGAGYTATRSEVRALTSFLEDAIKTAGGDLTEAASRIWGQYEAAVSQGAGGGRHA